MIFSIDLRLPFFAWKGYKIVVGDFAVRMAAKTIEVLLNIFEHIFKFVFMQIFEVQTE